MISISLARTGDRREGGALPSATVTSSTKSTFSVLLDEYKRQVREGAVRTDTSQQHKTASKPEVASSPQGSGKDQAKDVNQAHDVSADMMDPSGTQQKVHDKPEVQKTSKQAEKVSSTLGSDKDDTPKKAEDSDSAQNDQAWVLLSSMLSQPEMAQLLQAQSPHALSAQDSSPASRNGEAALPAEMSTQAEGNTGLLDEMKKASQQSVEEDKALASMVKTASLSDDKKGTGASALSATATAAGSQPDSAAQPQSPDDAHPIAASSLSSMQVGSASSVALPGNVQISGLSVTRELSSASLQRADAAHHQERNVDGASYLNVKADALYTTPSTQASATAEQNLVEASGTTRQDSENGPSEKGDQEGQGLATLDTARSNPADMLRNTSSQGALSDDGGHGSQNDQDTLLAPGGSEQEGQAKADNASSSGVSTAFQTMITAGDAHHSGDVSAQKTDTAALTARADEGDAEVDTHSSTAALAQKQVSNASSKLEMTVKTADAASVRVQVTRLPEGVAEVALQGADHETTKALTKSHHELLEQLNAAGIHSTSVKIEVLPAELSGMNGDQAQDYLGQNPSFGGQFGQGGGSSQEGQRQNYDGARSVLSSGDEGVGPVSGAENIVSHRRTLPAALSGSLNISV